MARTIQRRVTPLLFRASLAVLAIVVRLAASKRAHGSVAISNGETMKTLQKQRLSARYDWTGLAQLAILIGVMAFLLFWR